MLHVTADVFSGRTQPAWIIQDEAEARAILDELTSDRTSLAAKEPTSSGLGFRGFWIETLDDDLALDYQIPSASYLAVDPNEAGARATELAERLIGSIDGSEADAATPADALPLDAPLQEFLTTQLEQLSVLGSRNQLTLADQVAPAIPPEDRAVAAVTCSIELGAFNPGFWNDPATIRYNNCYNYASNWRTNTFAQPGRGCGQMYSAITCAAVTSAALCDGMHRRFDCFPDTEKPRYLVALVIAPGPGFIDYHWFRKQKEGFWGHKPGGTAARNVDNSGAVIYNPETANRGPYTVFCGYFYGCNTQRRRIA